MSISLTLAVRIGAQETVATDSLPAPLVPQYSADGTAILNGHPLKAVVVDPNPPAVKFIPPPERLAAPPEQATASFTINYIPAGGTDPWGQVCQAYSAGAQTAFAYAASLWANSVTSAVPITINACWANLGSPSILGYSGGGPLRGNFTNAPVTNTWYTGALANALAGSDLDAGSYDMNITYNSTFAWYTGTDGATPGGQYDLVTVAMHEIAHGLNFSGSMYYDDATGEGDWGYGSAYPNIYDRYARNGSGTPLINTTTYPNPSVALGTVLKSGDVWFHGAQSETANGDARVKLYTPGTWAQGSSYSHLDYTTFNNTPNQLMVYAVSAAEAVHDPGVVGMGLLGDMGWNRVSLAEALDQPTWVFTTGGTAGIGKWLGQKSRTHDAVDAAQSGNLLNGESSYVQVNRAFGVESVSFWYRVSSESGADYLKFSIDGVEKLSSSGTAAWTQFTSEMLLTPA